MVEVTKSVRSTKGLELTSVEWLLDHHRTKEQERRQMVADLNLKPGDIILDLGCGPGLWAPFFAEKVKPHGRVIGVDVSVDLILYAARNLEEERFQHIIEFQLADFHTLPFKDDAFDVTFFGNCTAYVTNAIGVLEEQKRVTKKGGRVVAKDFDGAIIIFHPVDPHLSLKILAAAAQALKEHPLDPPFDNFVGRKLHGLFLHAGFQDVSTVTYAIQKLSPLTPEGKRYIAGNAEWYAKIGAPYLSEEDRRRWRAHFDAKSEEYILEREDFYFCMVEVLTVGTV
ncbi:MAG: methyltransferase domain-containing protein [Nitrospiraceae bacterium]